MNFVRTFAPATIANLACGFDVLGLALEKLGDEVEMTKNTNGKVIIKDIFGDGGKLPREVSKNTCGVGVEMYLKHYGISEGVDMVLYKNLPLGSGLGSSSASSVAAVFAVNAIFQCAKTKRELLPFVIESERIACGSAHGDNVTPAMLGGVCYVRHSETLDVFQLPYPDFFQCLVITPDCEVNTKDSRAVLPKQLDFEQAKKQWANLGSAVHAFYTKDKELLRRCLQDEVAEPYRKHLIPQYAAVKKVALEAGAIACNISGSGPTIFCLTDTQLIAETIQKKILHIYNQQNMACKTFVSKVNPEGAKIILS